MFSLLRHSRPTRLPSCFVNFDPCASLNDFGSQGKPAASTKSSITVERPSFAEILAALPQPSAQRCQEGFARTDVAASPAFRSTDSSMEAATSTGRSRRQHRATRSHSGLRRCSRLARSSLVVSDALGRGALSGAQREGNLRHQMKPLQLCQPLFQCQADFERYQCLTSNGLH